MLEQALAAVPLAYEPTFLLSGATVTLGGLQSAFSFTPPTSAGGAYTPPPTSFQNTGPPFFVAEISIQKPGAALTITYALGYDTHPITALNELADTALGATSVVLVSDSGYRTLPTDTGIAGALTGVQCYWPSLSTAFQINRALNLDPSTSGVAASWGTLSLVNYANQWDVLATQWNSDNRPVKIYYGNKTLENFPEWRGTRASVGTYIDASGKMQSAPVNQVRWDWSTGTGQVLAEKTATNQVQDTTSPPSHNGSTVVAVSTDVPYLREGEPVFKSSFVAGGGGEYVALRAPSPNLIPYNTSITGSVYVWIPISINPTSRFIFNYETADLGKQINVDQTKTGRWVRYALTISNGLGINLIDHCTDYSSTYWSFPVGGGTITLNTTADIIGTVSADTLTKTGAPDGVIRRIMTIPADQAIYTFSVLFKPGTAAYSSIAVSFGSTVYYPMVIIRWSDLAVAQRTGANATINYGMVQSYPNGYKRLWMTVPNSNQTSAILDVRCAGDSAVTGFGTGAETGTVILGGSQLEISTSVSAFDVTATGTGNFCLKDAAPNNAGDVIYTTCWQIEAGTSATSFIHTNGTGATRATDYIYPSRQIWLDPSYSNLNLAFAGVSTPWQLSDTALNVPIRDATYWLERPVNSTQYVGTGGNEGIAAMAGVPKPMLRGIAYNITPTLIDAVNRLYQYNNAAGTIQALYEGGAAVITFQADVADLTIGTTSAGQYRTCNVMGMFQLGSNPVHQITVDATGSFITAGSQTSIANIARYLLTEDMLIPSANINLTSFANAATAYAYPAGIYIDSNQSLSGIDVLTTLMESLAAKLIINRTGQIAMFVLRTIPANTNAVATFKPSNIVNLSPKALPSTLSPPPYRWRVGYAINWTVQTSDLNAGSVTAAHRQYIGSPGQYATASSAAVLAAYARPNDHNPIGGGLTTLANAQTVANDMVALWSLTRTLYTVTLPIDVGIARDIGNVVRVQWPPISSLASGALGQIVGETFSTLDSTISYDVLI